MPDYNKRDTYGKVMSGVWESSWRQCPEDVPCVPERHILGWVILWYVRDQSCFMVLMGTIVHWKSVWFGHNHVIPIHWGVWWVWSTERHHHVYIFWGYFLGFGFLTQQCFCLIEEFLLIILRVIS